MKILTIQSSSNTDGLTCSLAEAAQAGAASKGTEVELVHLNQLDIQVCQACGNNWGHHRNPKPDGPNVGECIIEDDFHSLHEKVLAADGIIFCTPVYFGDLSESAKTFLDRLRRCEWPQARESKLRGKYIISIAAAGGSGHGALEAASNLEIYLIRILGMRRVIALPVTQLNKDIQREAARKAGELMVDTIAASNK